MSIYGILPYLRHKQQKSEFFVEYETSVENLRNGQKINIIIDDSPIKKTSKKPLTEEQMRNRYFLAALVLIVAIAICLICTLFATLGDF